MSQCDRFADLVTDLFKMRGVTGSIYNKNDNAILRIVDTDGGKTSNDWLQSTGLTCEFFSCLPTWRSLLIKQPLLDLHLRKFRYFDPGNSRSLELRFCSKMLLLHAWRQS